MPGTFGDEYGAGGNFPLYAGYFFDAYLAAVSQAAYVAFGGPPVAPAPYTPPDLTPLPPDTQDQPEPSPGGTPNPGVDNPIDENQTPGPPVIYDPGPPMLYSPGPPTYDTAPGPSTVAVGGSGMPGPRYPSGFDPWCGGDADCESRRNDRDMNPLHKYGRSPRMPRLPGRGTIPHGGKDQSWPGYDYGRFPKVGARTRPRGPVYTFPGPVLNAPQAPPADPDEPPDRERPDRERPPLFPPDEEPANDTSIRRPPVPQVEPVRVPDPAGVRAPFPQPPQRVELPGVPPLQVPKPEPPPSSIELPSSFPVGPVTTTAPTIPQSGSSSPTRAPATAASPLPALLAGLLPLAGSFLLNRFAAPGLRFASLPGAGLAPQTTPATSPLPGLTPIATPGVESLPEGASCETPGQTRQRRQQQRDNCERFITIRVPAHRRRVCAAEAGRILGRKLGKGIGRAVGRVLRGKPLLGSEPARASRRRKEPLVRVGRKGRSIELPGGFGVEIPKALRSKIPNVKLPGARRP